MTQYTYDSVGNCTSMTDAEGNTTAMAYDAQGRMISMTAADGSITRYEYTNAGKLVEITNAQGNTQTYTVDGNGFNTSESDWMGHIHPTPATPRIRLPPSPTPWGRQLHRL